MPEQDVIDLLKKDFETLSEEYEQDHFAQRIQYKLFARQRARMGVIGFAGGIGAALAASQMPTIVATVTPAVINEPANDEFVVRSSIIGDCASCHITICNGTHR